MIAWYTSTINYNLGNSRIGGVREWGGAGIGAEALNSLRFYFTFCMCAHWCEVTGKGAMIFIRFSNGLEHTPQKIKDCFNL